MAVLKPFQAIRPKKGLEEQMAALPYDVYNRAEAKVVVDKNPLSFLAIDRAETQFSDDVDTYADCVYDKAKEMLWDRVAKGEYVQEAEKCYYIYELVMDGRSQVGIVACASIDDYQNNIIKKHENTRADKEVDRIRHVSTCEAQTGPIFLAYRSNSVINEVVANKRMETPLYDFVADDGIAHKVWVINEADSLAKIENAFAGMNEIYIADGHHRCASAVKVGLKLREENPEYDGTEEFNFFLSVLFPDDQLMIMDYNRVVKDLNGNSEEEFILKLEEIYDISPIGNQAQYPSKKGEISMYMFGEWYRLAVKNEFTSKDPIEGLDVSILQNHVLGPILGIEDPKTDKRIDFVGGIRGLKELERRVAEDCKVAFAMYPTSINELFDVADAGLLMPPKSTWFEPKLRSGIFIHSIRTDK
ncbi:MAG: DUF1015 domain-containing protein [Lachnospiraceae bacterium]|nr:DUF1015 domain-containing protein [Lachnospiraceae bacterium]